MEPYPLEDLRRDLKIKLTVAPRYWFKDLWSPSVRDKESRRDELVDYLTKGWDEFDIQRPDQPATYRSPFEDIEIPAEHRGRNR